jgi:hypothetical protein
MRYGFMVITVEQRVVTDCVKCEKLPVPMTPFSMIGDVKLHLE